MRTKCLGLAVAVTMLLGCGGSQTSTSSPCFKPQPGSAYLNRDAIFVANSGSNGISAFQHVNDTQPAGPVCGSPFKVLAAPTALAGGILFGRGLLVLSQPGKSISMYKVDYLTSELTGPLFTITRPLTPMAIAGLGSFFYVANNEGNISGFQVSSGGNGATEIAGSPFPAGAGPVAIAAAGGPSLLYVANSQSNDISGYRLDPTTGVPTPLPGSPYPAGAGPSSVEVNPAPGPNPFGPRLVIVANKLSNSVSVFSVSGDGSLAPVPGSPFGTGAQPNWTSAGDTLPLKFVYVAGSDGIWAYSTDSATGALTPLGASPFAAGSSPASLTLDRAWLYVVGSSPDTLSVFHRDLGTGALSPVTGSPFSVGRSPRAVLYFQVPQ